MTDIGRWLFVAGIVLAAIGASLWAFGRAGFRGLPGDIHYQSDHVSFYFPIVTSLLLSAILTLALLLWRWFSGR